MLLLLAIAALFGADPSGFVVWKAADLKNYEKTLHAKLSQDHSANERLPDYEGHAVFAVHREGTGLAEAHEMVAHMIYVISGEATIVVGGTMANKKATAPGHTSGGSVDGGETKKVDAGDVLHIPAKVPHLVKVASGAQITYLMMSLEAK
jgi:mannose-6-phosphate isomerase-like protein (cupin superfamily)